MRAFMCSVLVCLVTYAALAQTRPASQPTDEAHAKKTAFIEGLQRAGTIGEVKLDGSHVGRAVVSKEFLAQDFNYKEDVANVLFSWCHDQDDRCRLLVLVSKTTGKDVGKYGPDYGGLQMD